MPERRFIVGPDARTEAGASAIRINGANPTFKIDCDPIARRLVQEMMAMGLIEP